MYDDHETARVRRDRLDEFCRAWERKHYRRRMFRRWLPMGIASMIVVFFIVLLHWVLS